MSNFADCELECGAYGSYCKCRSEKARNKSSRSTGCSIAPEAKEAFKNIREYASMIPLHSEDSHVNHFVDQITAWCDTYLDN